MVKRGFNVIARRVVIGCLPKSAEEVRLRHRQSSGEHIINEWKSPLAETTICYKLGQRVR